MLLSDYSVVTPYGTNVSSCGYCKSTNGSHTYGMSAHLMTCKDYQKLINRGWRRSGNYLYKPNLRDSCCPQYTIRQKASAFEASKHQRQILNRFNHFVQEGDTNMEKDIAARKKESAGQSEGITETVASGQGEAMDITGAKKGKPRKAPKNAAVDLRSRIRASEYQLSPETSAWKHRFRVKLEPSSCTVEKHALYVKYQMEVHKDPRSKVTEGNFTNFLVTTPLTPTKTENWTEEDPGFGSFHQCYYLDDQLIAVSVIDILPECVSAVYFFYDPDYSALSLGKYSAQREIAMVQTLSEKPGYEEMQYYYMGFYIFTCQKMTYKGHFHPSFLLDPETYNWVEFKKCQEILQNRRYSAFENPVPLDPLFEEKVQLIASKKKGSKDSDDEDDNDDWDSMDEDDEGHDLDENMSSSAGEEDFVDALGAGTQVSALETKVEDEKEEQARLEKERREERDRAYRAVTTVPPPGCMDPESVEQEDLFEVLCLTNKNTLRPVVVTDTYKNYKDTRKVVAEYFSYVGKELAHAMILYVR